MFDNYKVAVRVSLINGISAPLLMISRQFGSANLAAKEFQGRLDKIKDLARGGTMMLGGSMAIAAPFVYAIDKAAQLQKQMIGIQQTTGGTVKEMNNMRKAIEDVSSRTVFSTIDVSEMAKTIATGTRLGANQIKDLLPIFARFADVQLLLKGTGFEQSTADAIRLAHNAQKYTPEELTKYLDTLNKASFLVPGGLSEVSHALKYSQGIARTALGVDDNDMILLTALLNRMGFAGSRGGTNLIAAMSRTIPGVFGSGLFQGRSAEALTAMGMVDKNGHSLMLKNGKFDIFSWIGHLSQYIETEFARNPGGIARENIMKNFQHAFGAQGARVASLLSDPKAMEQLRLVGESFLKGGGVEAIQSAYYQQSVAQQFMNAKTNFVSAMTEIGYTLLPLATRGLQKLNAELQSLIKWITENPATVRRLSEAFLSLSAAMAFGGTVSLLTAGFKGLGIALELGGGASALLTGVASGFGGITLALSGPLGLIAALTALGLVIAAITPDHPDDGKSHTNEHWERHGRGGSWVSNLRNVGPRGSVQRQQWIVDGSGLGQGHWETVSPNATNGKMVQVHTQVKLESKTIANAVSTHVGRNISASLLMNQGTDPTLITPHPAAGH